MTSYVRWVVINLVAAGWPWICWAKEPRVFLEERVGPHLDKVIGVASGEFERPRLREFALQFADAVGARHITGVLWIVTSAADSDRVQGVRVTDRVYMGWRHDWMREYRTKYPVARVSVIDGGVRLEVRMADGRMTREVLRGGDPLLVEAAGRVYAIFHLYVREIRGLRGEGPVAGYEYKVMLCACDGVRAPLHEAVWAAFSRRLRARRLLLTLQMNTWFRDANVPTVYPFARPVVPPRTLPAANPFESWCDSADDRVACRSDP